MASVAVTLPSVSEPKSAAFQAALVARLRAIPDGQVTATAKRAGVPLTQLLRLRRGENTDVRLSTLERLARGLGELPGLVLSGRDLPAETQPDTVELEKEGERITLLSVAAGTVGAGPARLDIPDKPERYAFRSDWIKKNAKRAGRLVLVKVAEGQGGESMLPTIRPGALLMIDRGPQGEGVASLERDGDGKVYLVKPPGEEGMQVKRVFKSGEHLVLWSDNPATKNRAQVVPIRRLQLQSILLGRVRWVGRDEE